jgi:hypothetical protein
MGDGARALARLERDARALRRSLVLNAGMIRRLTRYQRAYCAIASIEAAPATRRERVAEARRIAQQLEKEPAVWLPAFVAIIRASADNAAGDPASAVVRLREAVRHAEAADLPPQAWAARYRLGKMLGGDEGRQLVDQAERSMRDEGIRSPERTAAWLVPGRWA